MGWAELQRVEHSDKEEKPKGRTVFAWKSVIAQWSVFAMRHFGNQPFVTSFARVSQEYPVPSHVPGQELQDFESF